jgi:hypothetical protein
MESFMASGAACAKPGRTWASRAAVREESRREQQFYRFVCFLVLTASSVVYYTDCFEDTTARFGR